MIPGQGWQNTVRRGGTLAILACLAQIAFGPDQTAFGPDQTAFGLDQTAFGLDQTAFGRERPSKPQEPIQELPPARDVIEEYVFRLGGYEMLGSLSSVHLEYLASKDGEMFDSEIYLAPGKYYSVNRYSNGRRFERGINRGVSWVRSNGVVRQLHGDELDGILSRHQSIHAATRWLDTCPSIECESLERVNGRDAYKLHFVHPFGREVDRFFDCKSKLLLRTISNETHGDQTHRVVRDFLDYTHVGELIIPKTRRIDADGTIYLFRVQNYEVDVKIPRGTFDLPANVDLANAPDVD